MWSKIIKITNRNWSFTETPRWLAFNCCKVSWSFTKIYTPFFFVCLFLFLLTGSVSLNAIDMVYLHFYETNIIVRAYIRRKVSQNKFTLQELLLLALSVITFFTISSQIPLIFGANRYTMNLFWHFGIELLSCWVFRCGSVTRIQADIFRGRRYYI